MSRKSESTVATQQWRDNGGGEVEAPLVYSLREFCRLSGFSRATVYEYLRAGRIVAVKRGRRTFIPAYELRRVVESLPRYRARTEDDAA